MYKYNLTDERIITFYTQNICFFIYGLLLFSFSGFHLHVLQNISIIKVTINEKGHSNLVLIVYASSECSRKHVPDTVSQEYLLRE